jgi:hypothetical protein
MKHMYMDVGPCITFPDSKTCSESAVNTPRTSAEVHTTSRTADGVWRGGIRQENAAKVLSCVKAYSADVFMCVRSTSQRS